jgi:hypothetical protein
MRKHVVFDTRTGKVVSQQEIPPDTDPIAFIRKQIHDCPDCRATLARSAQPIVGGPQELDAMREQARARSSVFARKPRWRNLKRRR